MSRILFRVALAIALLMMAAALLAPWLAPVDPYQISPADRLASPSWHHIAGTDELGRDLLSRILHGARVSLAAALAIVAIASSVGVTIGSLTGLAGGLVDVVVMRVIETIMALPGLVVGLALAAALGPSLPNLALALGLMGVPAYVRLARGEALALRSRPYVQAAIAMGASRWWIFRKHILPNMASVLLVYLSMHVSGALLAASALSFIGVGAQPPLPEWGAMINAARPYAIDAWWYPLFPGLALTLTAFSFNLIGDGLRDHFDPKRTR